MENKNYFETILDLIPDRYEVEVIDPVRNTDIVGKCNPTYIFNDVNNKKLTSVRCDLYLTDKDVPELPLVLKVIHSCESGIPFFEHKFWQWRSKVTTKGRKMLNNIIPLPYVEEQEKEKTLDEDQFKLSFFTIKLSQAAFFMNMYPLPALKEEAFLQANSLQELLDKHSVFFYNLFEDARVKLRWYQSFNQNLPWKDNEIENIGF